MRIATAAIAAALALYGCQMNPMPAAEPVIVTQPVDRIVQVQCKDRRPQAQEYPDTDAKLALIPDGDIFGLAKAFRAGRDLRDARLAIDDEQIKVCEGG